MEPLPDRRPNELGDFLRSRRARLNPKALGLPSRRRRRTPGLRREEVAELAGIGVDWYIRLEQGRSISPSVEHCALDREPTSLPQARAKIRIAWRRSSFGGS